MNSIKIYGREIGLGDWIAPNVHGVVILGRVTMRQIDRKFSDCEITTSDGDRVCFTINRDEHYMLFTFLPEDQDPAQDDLLDVIRGVGVWDSQRCCRMDVERLKAEHRYRYLSRDGRYTFKDGSAMRILPDSSRILYSKAGDQVLWPVRTPRNRG